MKKKYITPSVEVELYELDMSVASNCVNVVHNGPALGNHAQCEDYKDPFSSTAMLRSAPYNVNFYEDTNCDCYTTGGNSGFWTS